MSQQLGALQTHTTDTFLFISYTMNVLLFKFRCNIFIGVRIIKEMSTAVNICQQQNMVQYVVQYVLYRLSALHALQYL